jgi:hypothetical protein
MVLLESGMLGPRYVLRGFRIFAIVAKDRGTSAGVNL